MLGNGAYFGAMVGETPPVQSCETVEDLAECFRLFSLALRVQRMRAQRAPVLRLADNIRSGNTTARVHVDPLESRAHAGRTLPMVRRR